MSVRRAQASYVDNEAAMMARIVGRLGAVERIGHRHPDFPEPGGIPSEAEIVALIEATGDPRWVLKAGDTMTGPLIVPSSVTAGVLVAGPDAGTVIPVRVAGVTGTGYVGYYPDAIDRDNLGSRAGYVGIVSNQMSVFGEAGQEIRIGAGGVLRYQITAAGDHLWDAGSMDYDSTNDVLSIGPSILDSLRLARAASNAPYLGFYDTTFGTRYGYIQGTASVVTVSADTGSIMAFRTAAAETARFTATDFLLGKTASGVNVTGVQLFGTGHQYSTVSHTTATANAYFNRQGTAVATGRAYCFFLENDAGVGSITRGGANLTNYNTSSHGPYKGNVIDLDDDAALATVERWRPVAFQWKYDEDGHTSEHGSPSGPTQHGFIAQEMHEVTPQAVTPGIGTEADHADWLARRQQYDVDLAAHQEVEERRGLLELDHARRLEEHQAECRRILDEWQPVVETTTDAGLVVVSTQGEPVLPPSPPEPDLPEIGEPPVDPGPSPFQPWGGDWTQCVPDLAAAVQALIRQNRAQAERITALESRLA